MSMTRKWWVLASVACGTFMATLDSSIVNIALPSLGNFFNSPITLVRWVVILYLLTITCTILPFGSISDLFGRKRVFQLGFAVFTLGSLLCGFAPSIKGLLVFRVIQGLGAAMMMSNGPAIITQTFDSSERGLALGTLSMVVSLGLIAGPALGGILIHHLNWPSIFLLNIPIGITGIFLVEKYIDNDQDKLVGKFDWPGALIQSFVLVLLISLFGPPKELGMSQQLPNSVILLIVAVLIFLFVFIERKAVTPIFDYILLKNRVFALANLANFFNFLAFSAVTILIPYYLEEIQALTPDKAGWVMTAIPLTIFFVAPISGRLSDRYGNYGISTFGAALNALVLFLMAGSVGMGLATGTPIILVIGFLAGIGLALGIFQSPNNSALLGNVPFDKLGSASALLATVRNLGLVIGTGVATSLFNYQRILGFNFIASMQFTFLIAGFFAFMAALCSLGKGRIKLHGR
jgi:EmrB/QacA subfamily drug resistance transporter